MHINLKCFTGLILFIYLSNAVKEVVSQTRNSVPNYYAPWDNQYVTNNQWVRYTKPSRRTLRQSVPSEYLQTVVKYSPWENYRARSIGDYESAPLQLSVGERTKDELVFTDKANIKGNSGEDVESGRHIRPQTLFTITETLGALNTVGHYLVNMTRSTGNETAVNEDIPAALYTISKNVLGRNVTDTIAPLVREVLPSKVNTGKVTQTASSSSSSSPNNDNTRSCTTPEGTRGLCDDLSNCPQLLLNLGNLRQSLCFKSLFVPGVCCPIDATVGVPDLIPIDQDFTTRKPIQTTATLLTTTFVPPVLKPKPKPIPNNISLYVDAEECGQPESAKFRVIGGEEALPGRWPWMAAIFLHGPRRTEFWCGGSLITSKHVLTAAHCTRDTRQRAFSPRQFTVRLGDIDLKRDDEPSDPVTFRIADVIAHPRFSRVGFYNDIALFFLESPARKSRYIKPLCLPQPSLRSELFAGQRPTVVGWGTTYYGGKESTVQRQAVLPVWRNEDCNQAYFQPITENFICAGYSEGGVDACQGDSGGPLMLQWNGRWTQIGIVSFGNKCGEPGYPGVYTRVTNYIDWIHANTNT